jgi:hypothetical protein
LISQVREQRPFSSREVSTPSRLRGALFLAVGAGLLVTAFAVALVPRGGLPGLPSYPYFDSWGGLLVIETMVVMSAALTALAAPDLWRHSVLSVLAIGGCAIILGWVLFLITFAYAVPFPMSGGNTVFVQPFPQTFLVLLWGSICLLFLPIVHQMSKRLRRTAPHPP